MYVAILSLCFLFGFLDVCESYEPRPLEFMNNPAPDNHRCGVCPTYFEKVCAFNFGDNTTYIFDNHCLMDLFNCIRGTNYVPMHYDKCLFFGNFAYVHGYLDEEFDYGESHFILKDTKKNPDFA